MKAVKICGLQDKAMIDVALDSGAVHLGFVHFEKSPRHVELDVLENLTSYVGNRAKSWVVLAKPELSLLLEIAEKIPHVKGMQIHGAITTEDIQAVRRIQPEMMFMRAYSVADKTDLPSQAEMGFYDYLLFDAKPKPDDKLPGGNGTSFNWQIMQGYQIDQPWFLAGGLDAENVGEAIKQSGTQMVDVSSGVESSPGVKDANRIQKFIAAAQKAKEFKS